MIEKIYSNVTPGRVLHIVCQTKYLDAPRHDLVDDEQFLQLAVLKYQKGKTFRPHKHVFKEVPDQSIAQESWAVLKGKVKAIFYDEDDIIIAERILNEGDLSITLYGGHNYEIMEENTLVLEYKTGPYYGQALDKVFVDE
tara:strand:- start:7474 stop:7893 length:420 start_codon:yes stop_codon:yes gene_type:complete